MASDSVITIRFPKFLENDDFSVADKFDRPFYPLPNREPRFYSTFLWASNVAPDDYAQSGGATGIRQFEANHFTLLIKNDNRGEPIIGHTKEIETEEGLQKNQVCMYKKYNEGFFYKSVSMDLYSTYMYINLK